MRNGRTTGQWRISSAFILFALVFTSAAARSQDTSPSHYGFDPQKRVAFNFTNRDLAEVIRRVAELTGWSVFYNPAQVHGKVTIITPGKIPLIHALRLVQGVMHSQAQAIRVLPPDYPRAVPLASVIEALSQPREPRDVVVWSNSNARGPTSHADACSQQRDPYPVRSYWLDVIVDRSQ